MKVACVFPAECGTVQLYRRQIDVLRAAGRGLGLRATGGVLGMAEETVKAHRVAILKATRANNITHAAVIAARAGVL
jgi:DNA-binding NarL/FixJ family response regulator